MFWFVLLLVCIHELAGKMVHIEHWYATLIISRLLIVALGLIVRVKINGVLKCTAN